MTGEEAEERLPHGAPETRRRRHGPLRFRRAPGDEQREEIEEREARVDGRPRPRGRERDGEPARREQRRTVERDACADGRALLLRAQDVDRVRVDGDVLGGRREGDRERERRHDPRRLGSVADAREHERQREECHLRDRRPAAPAPEPRRRVPVHQRRPEDLERPRRLGERDESHDRDADAAARHPVGDGDHDETERQARREREKRHRGGAPRRHRMAEAAEGARAVATRHALRTPRRRRDLFRRFRHPPECLPARVPGCDRRR